MAKADVEIRIGVDDKATSKLKGIGNQMQRMSGTFKKAGIGMMAAGAALGGGLIALGKMAADFEGSMREVNTMVGLTQEGFEQLSADVQDVSKAVGKSSTELSGALYQIVSAGIDAADAIDVLEVAARAAVAGVTDTETAADGLTTILNAFKISSQDAGKVADVMFTVVKRGKTNFEELSAAIFQVAPIAAVAGVKFEEVAAAVATITKQGVPTKVATVQLRQAIQAIIKPTEDMKTAIEEMGFASGEAMLAEQGLAGTVNMVRDSAGGSLESLGKMFGSVEALGAVLSITGENAKTFAEDLVATTEGAAGAVDAAYEEMNQGVGRQFEILFNEIKTMGEEIGATLLPIFKDILEQVKPLIETFKTWVEKNKDLIPQLLKLAVILVGAGGVLLALSMISKAIIAVNIALAIFHGLSGPAGWIKLAAGMAIAGGAIAGIMALMGGGSKGGGQADIWGNLPGSERFGIGPPSIHAAAGGIFTKPTRALIGEAGPEAVIPLSRMEGMGGPIHIHVDLDGEQITEVVYERLLQRKGRNAMLGLA